MNKIAIISILTFVLFIGACSSDAVKHYSLRGRVNSINYTEKRIVIDENEIPGFMSAMNMTYSITNKNIEQIKQLNVGDRINMSISNANYEFEITGISKI